MRYHKQKIITKSVFFLLILLMIAICAVTGRTFARYYQSCHYTYTVTLDKTALLNKAAVQPKPMESSDTQQTDTTENGVSGGIAQDEESKGEGMNDAGETNQETVGDQTAEQR